MTTDPRLPTPLPAAQYGCGDYPTWLAREADQQAREQRQERMERFVPPVTVIWPAQCTCGHIFLERYEFTEPNECGEIGFCWCGFCRTRRWVKPVQI